MRMNVEQAPEEARLSSGPDVGDVYKVEGGRGGPRLKVIVARSGHTCYMLVFSAETGEVTGVDQVADYYLSRKTRIGLVRELPNYDVDWTVTG